MSAHSTSTAAACTATSSSTACTATGAPSRSHALPFFVQTQVVFLARVLPCPPNAQAVDVAAHAAAAANPGGPNPNGNNHGKPTGAPPWAHEATLLAVEEQTPVVSDRAPTSSLAKHGDDGTGVQGIPHPCLCAPSLLSGACGHDGVLFLDARSPIYPPIYPTTTTRTGASLLAHGMGCEGVGACVQRCRLCPPGAGCLVRVPVPGALCCLRGVIMLRCLLAHGQRTHAHTHTPTIPCVYPCLPVRAAAAGAPEVGIRSRQSPQRSLL